MGSVMDDRSLGVAISALLLSACGGPVPTDASAAGDAGSPETCDAGSGDPGWVLVPGLPDECRIERALHPERIAVLCAWEPCPGESHGCSRAKYLGFPHGPGWDTADRGWYDAERGRGYVQMSGSNRDRMDLIVDVDRGAIAAWRTPPGGRCHARSVAFGDGLAAIYIEDTFAGERGFAYRAPIDEIGAFAEPLFSGDAIAAHEIAVSSALVAVAIPVSGGVMALSSEGATPLGGDPVVGEPYELRVVAEHALWIDREEFTGRVRVAVASPGSPAAWLYEPDGLQGTLETDGRALAFVVREDAERGELWTSPVAFRAGDLAPRRVASITATASVAMGGGWYAYALRERLVLVELTSGRTKSWHPPPGHSLLYSSGRPAYVSRTEVVVEMVGDDGNFYVRLDPRELAWDP